MHRNPAFIWNDLIESALKSAGLDGRSLLAKYRLESQNVSSLSVQSLSNAYNLLWEDALKSTGDPAVGVYNPDRVAFGLGFLCQLVLSAESIQSALEALSRHFSLLSPTQSLGIERRQTESLSLEIGVLGCEYVSPPRYDFSTLVLLSQVRILTGCPFLPTKYSRPGPAPEDAGSWESAFQCEIEFGARRCTIELPASYLTYPIPTANRAFFDHCNWYAESQRMNGVGSASICVRKLLEQYLPTGEPRREDIASSLGVSVRSLSRRLASEGTSFAEILNDLRRELAELHLKHGDMTHHEISYALGFGDPSNFYRACKRWFGCAPGKLREAA